MAVSRAFRGVMLSASTAMETMKRTGCSLLGVRQEEASSFKRNHRVRAQIFVGKAPLTQYRTTRLLPDRVKSRRRAVP